MVLEKGLLGQLEVDHQVQAVRFEVRHGLGHHVPERHRAQGERGDVDEQPLGRPRQLSAALRHSPQDLGVERGGLPQVVDEVDELVGGKQAFRGPDAGEGLDVHEAPALRLDHGLEVDLDPILPEGLADPDEARVAPAQLLEGLLGVTTAEERQAPLRAQGLGADLVERPEDVVGRPRGRRAQLEGGDDRSKRHDALSRGQGHVGDDVAQVTGHRLHLAPGHRAMADDQVGPVDVQEVSLRVAPGEGPGRHRTHDLPRQVPNRRAVEVVQHVQVAKATGRDEDGVALLEDRGQLRADGVRGHRVRRLVLVDEPSAGQVAEDGLHLGRAGGGHHGSSGRGEAQEGTEILRRTARLGSSG